MHQDDASSNQTLKQQKVIFGALPKIGKSFLTSTVGREQGFRKVNSTNSVVELQTYAEDELVRKDYKEMQCEIPRTPRSTFLMVFSPDGTKVASTHGNHNIYVTDLRTGKNIQTLSGHPRTPWCIAFHPTSNQIVASGCLGGQVRIWDLSGGSEVWTTETQSVIASLAFHPNERLLVIATYNELYFWDWSRPTPFLHTCTNNVKEKVRYVAFDRLGHKLITGIANTPQTRWERVRAPVPVPRQAERSASPYRRRITPRLVTNITSPSHVTSSSLGPSNDSRDSLAGIPERERRITVCYRNLVEQYELLVHRYLEIYRPATTIDRGTDPMEPYDQSRNDTNNPGPSTSGSSNSGVSSNSAADNTTDRGGSSQALDAPSSNCGTQTFGPEEAPAEAQTQRSNTDSSGTVTSRYFDAALPPIVGDPNGLPPSHATPGPSGLGRFRSSKRSLPPLSLATRYKIQKHVRIQLSSDSSSSDDEPSVVSSSKRRATEQTQSGGGSGPSLTRTNTSDTGTTQSGHQFTIAQSHRGPSGNVPPFPMGRRRLYCHYSSAFSPTRPQSEGSGGSNLNQGDESPSTFQRRPPNYGLPPQVPPPPAPPHSQSPLLSTPPLRSSTPVDIPSPLSRLRGISEGMLSSADELINFAERSSSGGGRADAETFEPEAETSGTSGGNVGNVYSNILSDLEYSLDNVRNIRVSNRANNETTGVLSSFSQGLESIMSQSDSILRNLRQSLDMLLERDLEITDTREGRTTDARSSGLLGANVGNRARVSILRMQECRMHLRMNSRNAPPPPRPPRSGGGGASQPAEEQNFYVRYNQHPAFHSDDDGYSNFYQRMRRSSPHYSPPDPDDAEVSPTQPAAASATNLAAAAASRNPIADHTYPRNPAPSSPDYIAPLVTSLHITISHISRQARLLRRQVESIERIDRAMVEVSQLQLIRQMWVDVRSILANLSEGARRVSSMRQMMAGTRISDSNPSSESSETPVETPTPAAAVPSTSQSAAGAGAPPQRHGSTSRKTYPPSRLCRLQRQNRRYQIINPRRRRPFAKFERQPLTVLRVLPRSTPPPPTPAASTDRSQLSLETLSSMVQRLEFLLAEQTRNIGAQESGGGAAASARDQDSNRRVRLFCERITVDRLSAARARIHRMLHVNQDVRVAENATAPTAEGVSRMGARLTLSAIVDTVSVFFEEHGNALTPALRAQIKNVIELALLLTDIMLLQIVDSIPPPPTGVSLDPEREDLSARIDQMCSRMLANRLTSHSQQLTRSLRLMRLTARYASRALGITYQARRHALLPPGCDTNRRLELLTQINNCLRNMHRRRGVPFTPIAFAPQASTSAAGGGGAQDLPTAEWCQSVRELLTSFLSLRNLRDGSAVNAETGERSAAPPPAPPAPAEEPEAEPLLGFGPEPNAPAERDNAAPRPLYRSPAVNLVDPSPAPRSAARTWNLPTVQVNDMPVSSDSSALFGAANNPYPRHSRIVHDLHRVAANGLFRPRFLHPLYAGVNPFDADLDDPQREQSMGYDADMITTVTPNHRIQVWDISNCNIPNISNPEKNIVVGECKIHNDASVDIAKDGTLLVTLLPSGGYLNVTNRLGVYSLRWETLGQCLFTTNFEQNAVSVSLSPLSRHLIVGLASRRVSLIPTDRWTIARIFFLDRKQAPLGSGLPVLREIDQNRDSNYMSVNCIRWMPVSGQGLVYATNTGQLKVLS